MRIRVETCQLVGLVVAMACAGCAVSRTLDRDGRSWTADTPLECSGSDTCFECGTVGSPTCASCGGEWLCSGCFEYMHCSPVTVPPAAGTDLTVPDASAPTDAAAPTDAGVAPGCYATGFGPVGCVERDGSCPAPASLHGLVYGMEIPCSDRCLECPTTIISGFAICNGEVWTAPDDVTCVPDAATGVDGGWPRWLLGPPPDCPCPAP